ncbi:MAG: hypothetical protein FWD83_09245 [Promicromonosporaceae bacterium]|nr:hypothetical protein [Promicromonosporaceae bacterium]
MRVSLQDRGQLQPPADGAWLYTVTPGVHGGLVAVWVVSEERNPRVVFHRPAGCDAVAATYQTCEPDLVVPIYGLRLSFPEAQILPAQAEFLPDEILLVGTRCQYAKDGPELNAEVRSLDGKRLRRGCFGDGISHVRATPNGDVWVGYFDEGVFGNCGWGDADAPAPLGRAGVVRWSSQDFMKLYEAGPEADICDVYAATLFGEDLWTSTYVDFPLSHFTATSQRIIPTADSGVQALITDGATVVTVGEYSKPGTFRVWDTASTARGPRATGRIALPKYNSKRDVLRVMGHADQLHAFLGGRWYTAPLADFLP